MNFILYWVTISLLQFLILGDNMGFAGHERLGFFFYINTTFPVRVFNKRTEELRALAESKSQNWTAGPVIWKISGLFLKSFCWKTHETLAHLRTDRKFRQL